MPRVVRHRVSSMLDELGEQTEAIDVVTSDDGDHISEQSFDEDELSGDNSSESATEMDIDEDDIENVSLQQRLLDAQLRRNSRQCNGQSKPTLDLKGKSGYRWSTKIPSTGRKSLPEKVINPGPIGPAANLDTIDQFWKVLMPDEIFEKIVKHTNKQIEHVCITLISEDKQIQTYQHPTNIEEIKAVIGLFYYAAARKDSNVDTHNMWDKMHGLSVYRCTMSRQRFTFLCSCLRFHDKQLRDKNDKLAPIREIWTIFMNNCKQCYKISNKTTVGEQLLNFRGNCPFRVCLKSEIGRNKYGIKLISLNDSETSYLAFAVPYLGRDSLIDRNPEERIPEYLLRKVTESIYNTGRTVTCNSWFTSISLLDRFVKQPYNLTVTGTICKDKTDIPTQMKLSSNKVPNSNFCFSDNVTLLSYTPKKHKIVIVASSYLKSTEMINGKPKILLHYNETKDKTDFFNQQCHAYTTAMRTSRWPTRFFFGILDQAAVNARILYDCRKSNLKKDERISAYNCLLELSMHLLRPYLRSRIRISTLRSDLRLGIKAILNVYEVTIDEDERQYFDVKKKCELCRRKSETKTRKQCQLCQRAMCDEHRIYLCIECGGTY